MADETVPSLALADTSPASDAARKAKTKEYQRAWYIANRERKRAEYQANRAKVRARQGAFYVAHRDSYLERNRAYYAANQAALLEQKRQYYNANRQKLADRNKAYRVANAETLAAKDRARRNQINAARNKRYKESPKFRLRMAMSAAVHQSLKTGKPGSSWEKLVGYTVAELMRHIERQFLRGMSWDNREKWHVDHILPIASFEFSSPADPGFKACWALTNLRPLWAKENLSKNSRRLTLL